MSTCLSQCFPQSLKLEQDSNFQNLTSVESGWLHGDTRHPGAIDKIKDLEAEKVKVSEPEIGYDLPTFIEHLNNIEIKEKEQAVFTCKIQPANDPTIKIGRPY